MICPKCNGEGKIKTIFKSSCASKFVFSNYGLEKEYTIRCNYCKSKGKINKIKHVWRQLIKAIKED